MINYLSQKYKITTKTEIRKQSERMFTNDKLFKVKCKILTKTLEGAFTNDKLFKLKNVKDRRNNC